MDLLPKIPHTLSLVWSILNVWFEWDVDLEDRRVQEYSIRKLPPFSINKIFPQKIADNENQIKSQKLPKTTINKIKLEKAIRNGISISGLSKEQKKIKTIIL